jgi:ribosome modulation factor
MSVFYKRGRDAAHRGKQYFDCPYSLSSTQGRDWLDGFRSAFLWTAYDYNSAR